MTRPRESPTRSAVGREGYRSGVWVSVWCQGTGPRLGTVGPVPRREYGRGLSVPLVPLVSTGLPLSV